MCMFQQRKGTSTQAHASGHFVTTGRLTESSRGRAATQEIWVTSEKPEMLLINKTRERLLTELDTTEGKDMEALLSLISDGHNSSYVRGKYRQQ